jgi:hypothetical protein
VAVVLSDTHSKDTCGQCPLDQTGRGCCDTLELTSCGLQRFQSIMHTIRKERWSKWQSPSLCWKDDGGNWNAGRGWSVWVYGTPNVSVNRKVSCKYLSTGKEMEGASPWWIRYSRGRCSAGRESLPACLILEVTLRLIVT